VSTERKKLVDKLDKIFSKYIRARDKRSVLSGSTENLVCSHVFSRVSYSLRWSEENCYAMTSGENYRHEFYPQYIYEWFITKYGQDKYDLLYAMWNKTTKFSNSDLQVLIKLYQDKLKEVDF
jgi:hypothetical protein